HTREGHDPDLSDLPPNKRDVGTGCDGCGQGHRVRVPASQGPLADRRVEGHGSVQGCEQGKNRTNFYKSGERGCPRAWAALIPVVSRGGWFVWSVAMGGTPGGAARLGRTGAIRRLLVVRPRSRCWRPGRGTDSGPIAVLCGLCWRWLAACRRG